MPKLIRMPKIGVNMTDALISRWLVSEGDLVTSGQVILLGETDKAVQEIPISDSGRVVRLIAQELEHVECQQPILVLVENDEIIDEAAIDSFIAASNEENKPDLDEEASLPSAHKHPISISDSHRKDERPNRISPLAKKTAIELHINYLDVVPAKAGARITSDDVKRYAEMQEEAKSKSKQSTSNRVELSNRRKIIAERMTASVNTKPSVALTLRIDASELLACREKYRNTDNEIRYNEIIIAATANALMEYPIMNASLSGDSVDYHDEINIGFAVESEEGLVVPVIQNANKKSVKDIGSEIFEKSHNVRNNKINVGDVIGGTFTITNLGMYGIEQFDAIINPPECCILAVGAIVEQPVVKNNEVVIGSQMALTLVFDHRIVDGAEAAQFLQRIKYFTEFPEELNGIREMGCIDD